MRARRFVSHAQNAEDVVLSRALGHVRAGHYVDVGANLPWEDSTTASFYQAGWSGLLVEPVAEFADKLRAERPRDDLEQVLVGDGGPVTFHEFAGTGLSTTVGDIADQHRAEGRTAVVREVRTARLADLVAARPHLAELTHVLSVDVEGAEAAVLASADLKAWRPWVVVVEATRPNTDEPTHERWEPDLVASGYRFCLFDGLSRFYVAEEHAELAPALSYPSCVLDNYVRYDVDALAQEHAATSALVKELEDDLDTWRTRAATTFDAVTDRLLSEGNAGQGPVGPRLTHAEFMAEHYRSELDAVRRTVSWRVTAPLRRVSPLLRSLRAAGAAR